MTLPESNVENEDYLAIDVTALVEDMLEDPDNSFGFLMMLKNESHYRRLNFCSSDHEDPNKWPILVLTYTDEAPDDTMSLSEKQETNFQIFPNPTADYLVVQSENHQALPTEIQLLNVLGQELKLIQLTDISTRINLSDLASGSYFLRWHTNDKVVSKKVLIQ